MPIYKGRDQYFFVDASVFRQRERERERERESERHILYMNFKYKGGPIPLEKTTFKNPALITNALETKCFPKLCF